MARSSVSSAGFRVTTKELRSLAKDLVKSSKLTRRALLLGLKAAGEVVAVDARERASWSTHIPGTIKTRVSTASVSVKVVAGGPNAPDAAPLENHGKAGKFRHPVYGNRQVWVDQPARPYLAPAVDARQDEIVELVTKSVDDALAASNLPSS